MDAAWKPVCLIACFPRAETEVEAKVKHTFYVQRTFLIALMIF
jgi:hypothetical protein